MRIGIIEIMPLGHYTLVDSLVRIYGSNPNNEIHLFIQNSGEKNTRTLKELFPLSLHTYKWDGSSDLTSFFTSINSLNLDLCYIITLEKYFKEFYSFNFNSRVVLFIHNVDQWFHSNFKYILYHLFHKITSINDFLFQIKTNTVQSFYRKKIIKKLLGSNHRFAVLNPNLVNELINFVPSERIDFIPFSVYNPSLKDLSQDNQILRICIPGMVSEIRRDYYSLLNLIENDLQFYSQSIEFDFLGGIAHKEGGNRILEQIKRLSDIGAKIKYYEKPLVPIEEFDKQLAKADFILGNIKIKVDKFSYYGRTKETGIPFTMIRAAKPGILPYKYPSLTDLESSTLRFSDYSDLDRIIREIVNTKINMEKIKAEAIINSLKFEPSILYKNLVLKQL